MNGYPLKTCGYDIPMFLVLSSRPESRDPISRDGEKWIASLCQGFLPGVRQ
jgi:hypothetical protein